METYRDRIATTMPLTYADLTSTGLTSARLGAASDWQSSGSAAALFLPHGPEHEGTLVPFAGSAVRDALGEFTPEMRITGGATDVRTIDDQILGNDQFTNVPGRTWSPPV